MIGLRLMLMAGAMAASAATYRAIGRRRARKNPSGLPGANLGLEERRRAGANLLRRWRRRTSSGVENR